VIVAEDDPAIRRLLGLTLRRRGLDVQLAADGAQALAALQQQPASAIILDMMMPEVTGWEVVRWLGEHPEHRPPSIIVVSAAGPDVLRELDPTVVNAIIFKPFDVIELAGYVCDTVRRQARDRRRGRVVRTR
jgi:CheY-like chemotaxis protein